jgi:hypothetical protein
MQLTSKTAVTGTGIFALLCLPVLAESLRIIEKHGLVTLAGSPANEQVCQTGEDGRVQLEFGAGNIVRLGAKTTVSSGDMPTVIGGSVLFDFENKKGSLLLGSGEKVTVSSGTGFALLNDGDAGQGQVLLIGALAKRIKVATAGKTWKLQPGELLQLAPSETRLISFNLAKAVESAALLKDFQSPLPSRKAVQRESRTFLSLQRRGFVRSIDEKQVADLSGGLVQKSPNRDLVASASQNTTTQPSLGTLDAASGGTSAGFSASGSEFVLSSGPTSTGLSVGTRSFWLAGGNRGFFVTPPVSGSSFSVPSGSRSPPYPLPEPGFVTPSVYGVSVSHHNVPPVPPSPVFVSPSVSGSSFGASSSQAPGPAFPPAPPPPSSH